MELINVGYGNSVSSLKAIAILSPDSSPLKRLITNAAKEGKLIDATYGRKTRSIIVCTSGHVVLSPFQPDTIAAKIV